MARSTVQKTLDAADTLLDRLQRQRRTPVGGPAPLVEEATRQERASADDPAALEAAARAGQ